MTSDLSSIVAQFRQALADCQELYLSSAQLCIQQHPHLLDDAPQEFLQRMGDLHKGLLVKIYVTVAEADGRWSPEEQALAECLFKHLWQRALTGRELRDAAMHVSRQSDQLAWFNLFQPFQQISPLRDRLGDLETVVLRVANLIAKADGEVLPPETVCLRLIQQELDRYFHPAAPEEPRPSETVSAQAIRTIKSGTTPLEPEANGDKREASSPAVTAKTSQEQLAEALDQLNQLIGLERVKHQVHTLANFLKLQRERERIGLPQTHLSLHMVFTGNPGTGKTTVARILGRIYGAMGILTKGHLVETDRSGLVASYAGQTGPKTNERINEALDGVLFIDEAYSLIAEGPDDPYGHEAVQALLKRMEDDRERLVVVLAGYPEPMQRLLKSNPGLSSRCNTHLEFDDYRPAELGRIFQAMCDKNHYRVAGLAQAKLMLGFHWLYHHRDEHFGNGRLVRNTFENAIRRLANRVAGIAPLTKELLTVIRADDIHLREVPAEVGHESPNRLKFQVHCPGCQRPSRLAAGQLGQRAKCKKCGQRFVAGWGEPIGGVN